MPLFYAIFWVQIHERPIGSMSENMARQLENFIGKFLEYDTSIFTKDVKIYMRVKVQLDVRVPLKRKNVLFTGVKKQPMQFSSMINYPYSVFCVVD